MKAKAATQAAAERVGMQCVDCATEAEDEDDLPGLSAQYTFMSHNPTGVELLPFSLGMNFPAFLTYRAAVDKVRPFAR